MHLTACSDNLWLLEKNRSICAVEQSYVVKMLSYVKSPVTSLTLKKKREKNDLIITKNWSIISKRFKIL